MGSKRRRKQAAVSANATRAYEAEQNLGGSMEADENRNAQHTRAQARAHSHTCSAGPTKVVAPKLT